MPTSMCRFFVALGAAFLMVGAAPSRAATISYTDAACSSFAITGAAPNFTLVCSKLACSLAANPGSPLSPLSATTTLSTSCTPSGSYSYAWTDSPSNDAKCPPAPVPKTSTNTLTGLGQAVAGCVYQVDVNGGANGNGVATISLGWTATAVAAPTGCVITANDVNPLTLASGGAAVTLKASCTGGGAPTSYDWTGGTIGATGSNAATTVTNVTATTNFGVTPRNSGGAGNTASVTVNVSQNIAGGPITCSGFTATRVVDLNWDKPIPVVTPMGLDDAIVVRFTTGPINSLANNLPKATGTESNGPPSQRNATLSDKPCDFGSGLAAGASATTYSVTFPFTVGPNNTFYYPALNQNTTYYVNVKNAPNPSCASTGVCQMIFELQKPGF